jgi:ribosome-associated protein
VGKRIGEDGFLTILARSRRTQESNRRDAVERLVELVERACERPKARRATQPTKASKERRLEAKRHRGQAKKARQSRMPGDE